jgi:protein subunit release factor B
MLSDEGDTLSAVLQITAGAGGTESCDWPHAHAYVYGAKSTAIKSKN